MESHQDHHIGGDAIVQYSRFPPFGGFVKTYTVALLALIVMNVHPPIQAQWVQTGGPGGGIITCFVVSPNGAGGMFLFAGTYDSGVFLSSNNGTHWTSASTGIHGLVRSQRSFGVDTSVQRQLERFTEFHMPNQSLFLRR